MITFVMLILLPPVFLLMYYVGFITMTKAKIKQKEADTKIHVLRFLFGFAIFSMPALIFMLIKWLSTAQHSNL